MDRLEIGNVRRDPNDFNVIPTIYTLADRFPDLQHLEHSRASLSGGIAHRVPALSSFLPANVVQAVRRQYHGAGRSLRIVSELVVNWSPIYASPSYATDVVNDYLVGLAQLVLFEDATKRSLQYCYGTWCQTFKYAVLSARELAAILTFPSRSRSEWRDPRVTSTVKITCAAVLS